MNKLNISNYKAILRKIRIVVPALISVYIAFTMICAASYSIIASDDVAAANNIGAFNEPILYYIKCCLVYCKMAYLTWQGTYTGLFILSLLSPLNNYGFIQNRLVMSFNALFFFFAYAFFIWTALKSIRREYLYAKLSFVAIGFFSICGYKVYTEIFFWFTGAAVYCFPTSFLLIGLAYFLRIAESKEIKPFIGAILIGSLAMGGALMISGVGCYVALLVCIYLYMINKRIPWRNVCVLFIWIVCSLVNVLAPGNFVRYDVIDESGLHPIRAINGAVNAASLRWQFFFGSTNFVLILIILAGFGLFVGKKMIDDNNLEKKVAVAVLGLFTPVVAAFPLALGYSIGYPSTFVLPDRCDFVIDICIVLSAQFLAALAGFAISKWVDEDQKKILKTTMIVVAVTVYMIDGYGLSNVKVREVSHELWYGVYKDHYDECKSFMESLSEHEKGESVVIYESDFPKSIDNTYNLEIKSDWICSAFSKYYGFESMRLESD